MGRVELKQGNHKAALESFQVAAKIDPVSEDAFYYLGVYYFQISDYKMEKTYYEKSLAINNEQSETHLNLGLSYFRLKDYDSVKRI
ncbi:tetratricopeptide repeat protein [Paenibacillus sepulcri]|uniref:Tetratricopeptide repeat protein n=1 Tax=Paenibacillus sepulcri TaxID=359917 RepID=A0ABS7CEV7_9BACL|nr:tetratricopeptide repeat protein [Paenibacillus sepulcri]